MAKRVPPYEKKNKPKNWWTHSGHTWKGATDAQETEDQSSSKQPTPPSSEAAAKDTTLYTIDKVPIVRFVGEPIPSHGQLIDNIVLATKSGNRPSWYQIRETDPKQGDILSRKMQLFERLSDQYESLVERHRQAQSLLMDEASDQQVKKWTERVRDMRGQVSGVKDHLLLDMQCQNLSNVLLEVAQVISNLEEAILRENYDANKNIANLAAISVANPKESECEDA